jgi:hypothetical protein
VISSRTRSFRGVGFACVLIATMIVLVTAASALAAPAAVTIDDLEPALTEGDNGGSQIAIGLTNLTDTKIDIAAVPKNADNCVLAPDKTQLPPAAHTLVTISAPIACKADEGLTIELSTGTGASTPQTFPIVPKAEPEETKPDWHQLWAFGVALVVILLLLTVFYFLGWTPGVGAGRKLNQPLSSLDATWKFNDNWATNATTVGALLTGLFGATNAKAFLGEDAESLVALATVGAALALAFVATAPIVALATKSYKPKGGKRGDAFTVGGVLLAAAFVLAGAVGQLWVVTHTATELDIGSECLLWVPFALAVVLLTTYSWRSLKDVLERGTVPAAKVEPEVELKAAEMIAKAIKAATATGEPKKKATDELEAMMAESVAAAPEGYRRRPRSALI